MRAALLGVTKRKDGKRQVTYAGHPLYTYFGDTKARKTNGEGLTDFGGTWDAVAASGHAVEPTSPVSAGTGSGYGGYGRSEPQSGEERLLALPGSTCAPPKLSTRIIVTAERPQSTARSAFARSRSASWSESLSPLCVLYKPEGA